MLGYARLLFLLALLSHVAHSLKFGGIKASFKSQGQQGGSGDDDDEDDDDYDDDDDEEEGMNPFAKIAVASVTVGGLAFAAKKAYTYYKMNKGGSFKEVRSAPALPASSTSSSSSGKVSPETPIGDLLQGLIQVKDATDTTDTPITYTLSDNEYACLIFDCNNDIATPADKKARKDYFSILANITENIRSDIAMSAIYIPGKKNAHVIEEKGTTFKPTHWKYLPSKLMKQATSLRDKFNCRDEELRIVVLGPDQKVVSDNALDLLRVNPRGLPWPQTPFRSILGSDFLPALGASNESAPVDLKGKKIGLYFSASWCKPCHTFSPLLTAAYQNLTEQNVEIVYVSLDQEEAAFNEYRANMPWLTVPFADLRRGVLQIGLGVRSIPALIFVDENDSLLTSSGVTELLNDNTLSRFPWQNDVIDLSSGALVEKLQRSPALIAFTEKTGDATKASARAALKSVSENLLQSNILIPRSNRDNLILCVVETEGKIADALRELGMLKKAGIKGGVEIMLLDLVQEVFANSFSLSIKEDDAVTNRQATVDSLASHITKIVNSYQKYELKLEKLPTAAEE